MKPFLVVTNSDYIAILLANDADDAIQQVAGTYLDMYGEERDDWEAYNLIDYLDSEGMLEGTLN